MSGAKKTASILPFRSFMTTVSVVMLLGLPNLDPNGAVMLASKSQFWISWLKASKL